MLNLDEIKKRAEAATPGPWTARVTPYGVGYQMRVDSPAVTVPVASRIDSPHYLGAIAKADRGHSASMHPTKAEQEANAQFIAHARADVPALMAEVEMLRADLARLTADCAAVSAEFGLPPTMRPAAGETRRMMAAAAEAERLRRQIERIRKATDIETVRAIAGIALGEADE